MTEIQLDRYTKRYQATHDVVVAFRVLAAGVDPTEDQLARLEALLDGVEWYSGRDESIDLAVINDDKKKTWINAAPGDWLVRDVWHRGYGPVSVVTDERFHETHEVSA